QVSLLAYYQSCARAHSRPTRPAWGIASRVRDRFGGRVKMSAPGRRRRWPIAIGLAVVLVLGTAFAVLRLKLAGPGLADNIASLLNKRMRGRIEVGSIEWSTSSLTKAITGGWIPITIREVRLWDDCVLGATTTGDALR